MTPQKTYDNVCFDRSDCMCVLKKKNLWSINHQELIFFFFGVLPLVALSESFHNAQHSPGDSNLKSILIDLIFNPLLSSAMTDRKHSAENIAAGHRKLLVQMRQAEGDNKK